MSQDEVVAALATPDFYPHRPRTVEYVQTHISHVFLAGPYVYKLKKAVRFPFLDFSTAELRRHFCLEEVRLNRRLAPGVYLDVLPVVRGAGGGPALGAAGEALDHVVWMRRLPPGALLVNRLGESPSQAIDELASVLAFLAMDLETLERPDLARRFVAAYAAAADDPAVDVLIPFYACYRACVRGKVEGLASIALEVDARTRDTAAARARRHFTVAVRYAWQADGPAIIACGGLAGTGKSTLARELAATTGFALLATDEIRKRGPAPDAAGLYTPAARARVYDTLVTEAEAAPA